MSNGNTAIPVSPVNDMIGALGAALASHARVPTLEARISDLETTVNETQRHNQGLETNIIDYKQTIADLLSKVRSLEVERDDASFRVLETEDRLATLLAACRSIGSALGNAVDRADPPAPVQAVKPIAPPPQADNVGESAADPTIGSTLAASPESAVGHSDKGQSVNPPTPVASASAIPADASMSPVDISGAANIGDETYRPFEDRGSQVLDPKPADDRWWERETSRAG